VRFWAPNNPAQSQISSYQTRASGILRNIGAAGSPIATREAAGAIIIQHLLALFLIVVAAMGSFRDATPESFERIPREDRVPRDFDHWLDRDGDRSSDGRLARNSHVRCRETNPSWLPQHSGARTFVAES
jgi:hypothetical protein